MAQEVLWNIAKKKMLEDKGAFLVREYNGTHEVNFLSSWLRDSSAPRKSRLSAPQIQAQHSRLTDRSRLRRLKDTLLSKGA